MIGVLAIIAILVSLFGPQIMDQVQKGKVVALAQSILVYRKAIEVNGSV
jgi:type II secretory pathway pseudopilin PulG